MKETIVMTLIVLAIAACIILPSIEIYKEFKMRDMPNARERAALDYSNG